MDFLKTIIAHDAVVDGRCFQIGPPSVRMVLTMIGAAAELPQEETSARALFLDAVKAWLPRPLFRLLFPTACLLSPWWQLLYGREVFMVSVQTVMQLLSLWSQAEAGTLSDTDPDGEDETCDPATVDWTLVIAEYSAAFGTSPEQVLDMEWPLFLRFSQAVGALHARATLRYLSAKGLPHIESDDEREEAYRALRERAYPSLDNTGDTPSQSDEERARTLDQAKLALNNPHAAKQLGYLS